MKIKLKTLIDMGVIDRGLAISYSKEEMKDTVTRYGVNSTEAIIKELPNCMKQD